MLKDYLSEPEFKEVFSNNLYSIFNWLSFRTIYQKILQHWYLKDFLKRARIIQFQTVGENVKDQD